MRFLALFEMPQISLQGKTAMAGDKPLKSLPVSVVAENIVLVRQADPGGFVAQGWTVVYFMDSPEAAQMFRENKIPYLLVPRGSFYGGGSPITDIWKARFQKEGQQHILGMIEANTMPDSIYIDMMTVRSPYRRQSITSKMVTALQSYFPQAKLSYSSPTDQGSKFIKGYQGPAK